MAFSSAERARREKAIRGVIEAKGLKVLILIGDTNVGGEYLGDFRYFVDNRIIAGQQVAILFPQGEAVLFAGTAIQQQAASRRSSVRDCRVSDDLLADTIRLLKERSSTLPQSLGKIFAIRNSIVQRDGFVLIFVDAYRKGVKTGFLRKSPGENGNQRRVRFDGLSFLKAMALISFRPPMSGNPCFYLYYSK